MHVIALNTTDIDDPAFVAVASSFLSHFASVSAHTQVLAIHIDNWFGERWLGFHGKFLGAAGMRNKSLHNTLPVPPFNPNRVLAGVLYSRQPDGEFQAADYPTSIMHMKKNGGHVFPPLSCGLYCWYSGNTVRNTNGCAMFYAVTNHGADGYNDAWYLGFDKLDEDWRLSKTVGISMEDCNRAAKSNED